MRGALAAAALLGLTACASAPPKTAGPDPAAAPATQPSARKVSPYAPAKEDPSKRGNYTAGGLYAPGVPDSAPDAQIDVSLIPEPEVVALPRSRYGNRDTYTVLGKQYHVLDDPAGYVAEGVASYYGTKFHGRRTSNMEVYDMYAFTAAHKTLPLPSFARVTNLDNGRSVVVRVNDRGPFHEGRLIDLSYAAAIKLGITRAGTGRVEVRALVPGEPDGAPVLASAPGPAPASSLDTLVAALPADDPDVAGGPSASAAPAAAQEARLDTQGDGRPMTADEFDAWMKARRLHVATGKPAATGGEAAVAAAAVATADQPAAVLPAGDTVVLQVASFSARGNADRALGILREAGIGDARLLDARANGQQVWRLRVGPLAADAVADLAARITGLGFGPPQRVHD